MADLSDNTSPGAGQSKAITDGPNFSTPAGQRHTTKERGREQEKNPHHQRQRPQQRNRGEHEEGSSARDRSRSQNDRRTSDRSTSSTSRTERERKVRGVDTTSPVNPVKQHRPVVQRQQQQHQDRRMPVVGFDNSDKNETRQSIGSSTDRVASERRVFRPWLKPDSARQQDLVTRLAPHRPPAPPDPKFNGWVNHFEYYCNIGVDVEKQKRGNSSGYQRTSLSRSGGSTNGYNSHGSGVHSNGSRSTRLLRRPRTTPGRCGSGGGGGAGGGDVSNCNNGMMSSGGGPGGDGNDGEVQSRPMHAGSGRKDMSGIRETQSAYPRGYSRQTDSGRSSKSHSLTSGLDRRYMGLQSVSEDQMREIVARLTRMTSAYTAKFAPNPHVWTDSSPGAHMVVKRENSLL